MEQEFVPIPEDFLGLFEKKTIGHLATLMADGAPQVTPVWIDYDGQHVLVNTATGRVKDRNMSERPTVAVEIMDPDSVMRYVSVRGSVVDRVVGEEADAHIDKLAQRYMGRDKYPESMRYPGEARVLYRIAPSHVFVFDPFKR